MAFLDNSGDIILDAVLTDTGRARLAKGDGTFRIVKFALGDDEIDYTTYKNSNHAEGAHASGSAYYDLDILQSPILEAFTNNTSVLKSKLLSLPRTNLLYLPVLKLQRTVDGGSWGYPTGQWNATANSFYVISDQNTRDDITGAIQESGIINGVNGVGASVVVHQGLDTSEISHMFELDQDLFETQYIIEMDNRLGHIVARNGGVSATLSFIDDDQIASYFLSMGTDGSFVGRPPTGIQESEASLGTEFSLPLLGPRGSVLSFSIKSSLELRSADYLFTRLGNLVAEGKTDLTGLDTANFAVGGQYYYIDTNIRVTAATTGYRLDIPVRFIRKK